MITRRATCGLAGLLALALTGAPAARQAPDAAAVAARIDALVAPHADAGLVSGVILVDRGGQPLVSRAFGHASWELGVRNTPAHRFNIASITKPLTDTLVHVLAADGRLDLDAPVAKYLPGFPAGPKGGIPTVRQLLAHRAGVPHRVTDAVDETQPLGPAGIVARVKAAGLLFEPGERRLYSSAGYTCLARIAEVVEGRPYAEVLEARVFGPAGMSGAVDETGTRLMRDRALPHRLGADEDDIVVAAAPYKDLRFLTGAGSVYATAGDLVRFARAVRRGTFGKAFADEAFQGDPAAWHSWTGRTNGYESWVHVVPAEDLVYVFLSNLQSASNWQIDERIRQILRGEDAPPVPLAPPPVAEPAGAFEPLVGAYGNPDAPAEIAIVDGRPFRGDNEFYAIGGGRYYIPGSGSFMRFRRNASGEVDALLSAFPGGEERALPRLARQE